MRFVRDAEWDRLKKLEEDFEHRVARVKSKYEQWLTDKEYNLMQRAEVFKLERESKEKCWRSKIGKENKFLRNELERVNGDCNDLRATVDAQRDRITELLELINKLQGVKIKKKKK